MAQRRVIWDTKAVSDIWTILEYWEERNKSKEYSKKLFTLFRETIAIISKDPYSGQSRSDQHNIRFKPVDKKYLIIYEILVDEIRIKRFWNSSQNPDQLKF
jgi:plasmid stabilization system protein ParE